MTDEDWRSRISEALEDEVSWVIQQNVKSDKLQFDYIGTDGTITSLYQSYSVNPFIFGDAYAAPFIRVERDDNNRRLAIANVSAMAICGVMINPLP
jgi:hypothetical protein